MTLLLFNVCSVSFIIISFLIFRTSLPKPPNILLYNLIIIISLQGLPFRRAMFFFAASVFFTMLISLGENIYELWNVPLFFVTLLIVKSQIKKRGYYNQVIDARIEEIKEKVDILTNEYEHHKKEAVSLEERLQRYKSLNDIASHLNSISSSDKVIDYIRESALQIVSKTESIFFIDAEKKDDVLDEWIFRNRESMLAEDIRRDSRFSDGKFSRSFRSVISAPLIVEKKVFGILRLEHSKPYNYTSEDLKLLDILCDLGAVRLHRL